MTKGRFVGAAVVLGFQDIEGMKDAFGEKSANEIVGLCANKAVLRVESPETAKWAESVFGQIEVIERKSSKTSGTSQTEGSSTTDGDNQSNTSGMNNSSTRGTTSSRTSTSSRTTNDSSSENFEKAVRQSLLASEFMSLPPTNKKMGLAGFFINRWGAAKGILTPQDLLMVMDSARDYPRVDPRPALQQYLKAWSDDEMRELGIAEGEKVKKDQSDQQASPDPQDSERAQEPDTPIKLPNPLYTQFLPRSSGELGFLENGIGD